MRSAEQVRRLVGKTARPGGRQSIAYVELWECNREEAGGDVKPPHLGPPTPQTGRQEKQSQRTHVEAAYFIGIQLVKNNFTY